MHFQKPIFENNPLNLIGKKGFNLLPEPSACDLYFDIESVEDHTYPGGLEYLFGIYYVENEKAEELLHEYVVDKARSQYEKVLDEADEVEESEEEAVEEAVEEDEVVDETIDQTNDFEDDIMRDNDEIESDESGLEEDEDELDDMDSEAELDGIEGDEVEGDHQSKTCCL